MIEITIEPDPRSLGELARPPAGELDSVPMSSWRSSARAELGLEAGPVVATGHQTLLWHPGILVKYLLVEALRSGGGPFGAANLVVDQHTGDFDRYEVPVLRADEGLSVAAVALTEHRPEVPMGALPAFDPAPPPRGLRAALPSVGEGVRRIFEAVSAHRGERSAALQMAAALEDLMSAWVSPMPRVLSSDLISTRLSRALVERMARDPARCARLYNEAVASVPRAGMHPLAIAGNSVELPLWYLGPGRRRCRATDAHARDWLARGEPPLLPRALFLTALVRLAMCDLFVHGTGGAAYDRAMEIWLERWLGVRPAPIAVATATLRLPLRPEGAAAASSDRASSALRKLWHDPADEGRAPSKAKQAILERIRAAPRRSAQRRELFAMLHRYLAEARRTHESAIGAARDRLEHARRARAETPILERRTWAFPLYPRAMIDELAAEVARRAGVARSSVRAG